MSDPAKRTPRRRIIGLVTSTKMAKTIVVESDRTVQHPEFKKYMKRTTAYKAHDEKADAQVGDRVEIMETRPLSKTKCFRLIRIIERARIPASTPEVAADVDPAVMGIKKPAPAQKRGGTEA